MISYSASLTQRFQEQEEAWIDARTGLPVPGDLARGLCSAPRQAAPDAAHPSLEPDLPRAVAAAHRQLEDRAAARRAALVSQARPLLERELAQVDAYYEAALASLVRRQAGAPEERHRLLEDQAAATRAEHARRRREIHDEFRARHEVRPFRMHLVLVPAFVLEVAVRRGPREYPFALTWMPISGSFAAVRCPHCDAAAELVAGRDRLGCQSCLTAAADADAYRPLPIAAPAVAAPPAAPARPAASGGSDRIPSPRTPAPGRTGPSRSSRSSRPSRAAGPVPSTRPAGSRSRRRAAGAARRTELGPDPREAGPKLALAFWQAVAAGERWPKRKVARDSPLSALYRVYGAAGPLRALGVLTGRLPTEADALALPPAPGEPELTMGAIVAGGTRYPYVLGWMVEDGRPVLCEVTSGLDPAGPHRRSRRGGSAPEAAAPDPVGGLDPVASALWRSELPAVGLALTVRCLATWWRVEELVGGAHRPEDLAAAVAGAVSRAAGVRRAPAALAAAYASEPLAARAVGRELGAALDLDPGRGW
jgi:hypothetical protein